MVDLVCQGISKQPSAHYDPFYVENGIVDPLKIINRWRDVYGKMKDMGLKSLVA